ncbi:unnamed protein product [Macrosiphum euphorbiae]|uniref:THAP-type domain-containing protein n=1 Tax=Macrosiphum euphorbiae TaxID=13131 RepID=A0AAV0XML8_9HEMI|nr:unnamed protein product [Macrosiphum euphorbiae]
MHKCVVCSNSYKNTKGKRPRVIYHGFPKDESMRKKWLQVFKMDRCYDWHLVCSDHFLERNYKPKKKRMLFEDTIPQPYGYSSKYALLSNYAETGNISPRQSSTLTTENMSNKNMPRPTLRSGLRCSIKNCSNRLSKDLSLFGYPKDFELRKKWIEKCGLKNDTSEIVITGIRVCSAHFTLNCFRNIHLKNRLKKGAVPSLFLDSGTRDSINKKWPKMITTTTHETTSTKTTD